VNEKLDNNAGIITNDNTGIDDLHIIVLIFLPMLLRDPFRDECKAEIVENE
jgi:hypothetical protein